ncbi:MAG: ATP-binding cassette domain-containing protein [Deltaproteobacteria bacterium]|nr:ATP-binding cassette domain-containing protein [Deltaproteobacteria bacterium]
MAFAVETSGLTKTFGDANRGVKALDGVSLSVGEGEFFGLLGPNGAGKTTLIRILTTLIRPTSGTARVMGIDVAEDRAGVRERIGVVPQATTSDLDLTGIENMDIYGRFYSISAKERRERIDYLLEIVGLKERGRDLVATYSGGMRRRLEVARALMHRPALLILDEPTLGLDPQSRLVVWDLLTKFRESYRLTILLTTHYMAEAEALCERIAIIDYGKIVAIDTIDGLKKGVPEKDVVTVWFKGLAVDAAAKEIGGLKFVRSAVGEANGLRVAVDDGPYAIPLIMERLKDEGAEVTRVFLKELTLEDVFIHHTGRPIREEEAKGFSYFIGAGMPRRFGR